MYIAKRLWQITPGDKYLIVTEGCCCFNNILLLSTIKNDFSTFPNMNVLGSKSDLAVKSQMPTKAIIWTNWVNLPSPVRHTKIRQQTKILQCNPQSAKKNSIWKCRLFMSSAEYLLKLFNPVFAYRQTVWTQIRLLLEEQSDLGPYCLQKMTFKIRSRWQSRRQLLWLAL